MKIGSGSGGGEKKEFPEIKGGQKPSRLVGIATVGVHTVTDRNNVESDKPRIFLTFELPNERLEWEDSEGETVNKPRWLNKEYLLSSYEESNLYKSVKAIDASFDAENGDLENLLGAACMVNVGHTNTGNPKVIQVLPTIEGFTIGELENEVFLFDFDNPTYAGYEKLPALVKWTVKQAVNYPGSTLQALIEENEAES